MENIQSRKKNFLLLMVFSLALVMFDSSFSHAKEQNSFTKCAIGKFKLTKSQISRINKINSDFKKKHGGNHTDLWKVRNDKMAAIRKLVSTNTATTEIKKRLALEFKYGTNIIQNKAYKFLEIRDVLTDKQKTKIGDCAKYLIRGD